MPAEPASDVGLGSSAVPAKRHRVPIARRPKRNVTTRKLLTDANCESALLPFEPFTLRRPLFHSSARAWKHENAQLQKRVVELEQALRSGSASADVGSSSFASSRPGSPSNNTVRSWHRRKARRRTSDSDDDDGEEEEEEEETNEPFGTGALVLSADGNLHLGAEATFYRPGLFPIPRSYVAAEALIDLGGSNQPPDALRGGGGEFLDDESSPTPYSEMPPPHEATYLPYPLDPSLHQQLLDLFFAFTSPFGMNSFKTQFMASMRRDPTKKQLYFSPFLHLVCLGIGSRYNLAGQSAGYYTSSQDFLERGEIFIDRARAMADSETQSPTLGTILGLVYLSIHCYGMMKEWVEINSVSNRMLLIVKPVSTAKLLPTTTVSAFCSERWTRFF